MSGDWARTRELFERAEEIPAERRAVWLAEECGTDQELLARVSALLAAEASADFSEQSLPLDAGIPADLLEELGSATAGTALLGRTLGGFRITAPLGAGGMGVVFRAEQDHPRREVALKVLAGALVTDAMRTRFRYEGEVLGRLRHPHIAQVFATGSDPDPVTGQPILWIAMELVEGGIPLDQWLATRRPDETTRLATLLLVCDAIEHGHRQGVLHRDLKPGNVLIDAADRPKVIDFGIARSLDSTGERQTLTGQILGTPRSMSPEQLAGDGRPVDTRADVYALGVLLFVLLTGREPRAANNRSLEAFAREVLTTEPPRPSSVHPVAIDLDWICVRAMARRPEDRYGSVGELAADLRRYLASEPVAAGPPSTLYVVRRFVRRHRALVAALSLALLTLVAGTVVATLGWQRAARNAGLARAEARTQAAIVDWLTALLQSARVDQQGRDVRVVDLLDAAEPRLDELATGPADVEAAIRNVVAQTWLSLDQDGRALQTLRDGLDRLRAGLPTEHSAHGEALYLLGVAQGAMGDYANAQSNLEAALQLRRTYTGDDSLTTAHVLHALGVNRVRLGEPAAADALLAHAARIFRTQLGSDDPKTLATAADRVDAAHQCNDYESVREALDAALADARRALGPSHPVTVGLTISAANDARQRGARDEAEAGYREALDRTLELYGDGSPKARQLLGNLAVLRQDRGDFDGAAQAFADLVAQHVAAADDPLQEIIARNNLASIQLRGGHPADALASYQELLRRADGLIPADHWLHATFLRGRGSCHTALGHYDDAEPDLLRALSLYEATLGPDNPRTLTAVTALAELHEAAGRPERAAPYRARLAPPDDSSERR